MTTLVAIPYYGVAADLLEVAVVHALAQTADVVVLVAGDGQRPPITLRHDRLVVGTFATNRGTPFTQQAMLLGSPFDHYAPHGADDWIDSDHIATLLGASSRAAGSRSILFHTGDEAQVLTSPRTWIEFGAFRSDRLRAVGGYNPMERAGQDSVLTAILLKTGGVALTNRPTYHKRNRPDSLTHHPDTRQGSPFRVAIKERNRIVLRECERLGWHPALIRRYREGLVGTDTRIELEYASRQVARWLA